MQGHRLAFLIIEKEPHEALSTRKLLLESCKHNVITAHSGAEGISTMKRFPNVDAVVVDATLPDMRCDEIVKAIKSIRSSVNLIGLAPNEGTFPCDGVTRTISSHEPGELLKTLEEMGGTTDL